MTAQPHPPACPPIPPGCAYFSTQDEGPNQEPSYWFGFKWAEFGSAGIERDVTECLCHCDDRIRPIIAAVAEVAWLREAERLERETPAVPIEAWEKAKYGVWAARDNARAWRRWSEQGVR